MFLNIREDWTTARDRCKDMPGADMVSIGSAQEDLFIRNIPGITKGSSTWLGFTDTAKEGTFVWSDNSPVCYTNWHRNEPNQHLGNEENCVHIHPHWNWYWNDIGCTNKYPTVCEKRGKNYCANTLGYEQCAEVVDFVCEKVPEQTPNRETVVAECKGTEVLPDGTETGKMQCQKKYWVNL